MSFEMSLVDIAALLAAFTTILGVIAGLVTWALNLIIRARFSEFDEDLTRRFQQVEKDYTDRMREFMHVSSCEKIRDEQATHLRVIIRDELNKWHSRQTEHHHENA